MDFVDRFLSILQKLSDNLIEVIPISNSIPEILAMKTVKNVGLPNTANTQVFGNFEDYVLKAYEKKQKPSNTNALYKDLSGFGSSAALATLLRNNPNNPALITSYLNAGGMNPSNFDEQAMKTTYSNYLQNNFVAKQLDLLADAKLNLSNKLDAFKETIGDQPTEAEKLRLEKMTNNVALVDDFVTKKQQQVSQQELLQQMNHGATYSQYLFMKENKWMDS